MSLAIPVARRAAWAQRPDPRIVRPIAAADANANRIHDAAEGVRAALAGPPDAPQDYIICFDHPPGPVDAQRIANRGGAVRQAWNNLIYAVHATLPANRLAAYVAFRPDVVWVEPDLECQAHLAYSTRQIHAREAWQLNGGSYLGDGDHNIAILDTGLDDSHPDIGSRIVAWKNIAGTWPFPEDERGHGTSCAGIAAGSGAQCRSDGFSVSYHGELPAQRGPALLNRYHLNVGPTARVLTARMQFQVTGEQHYLQLLDDGPSQVGYGTGTTQDFAITSSPLSNVNSFTYQLLYGQTDNGPADYSAFCAKSGSEGVTPPDYYPNYFHSIMACGPFDLSNATSAQLTFARYTNTEVDFDPFWVESSSQPPGGWVCEGDPTWGKDDYRVHSGSYSVYCARSGSNGVVPPADYPNGCRSFLTFGPFDLSDATSAEMSWWDYTHTAEPWDYFDYLGCTNGANWHGLVLYNESGGPFDWHQHVADLATYVGEPEVWVRFTFRSNSSVTGPGTWLDDVVITKQTAAGPVTILDESFEDDFAGTRVEYGRVSGFGYWTTRTYTLNSAHLGDSSVWLLFHFYSDASLPYPGVWLDDVHVTKKVGTTDITLLDEDFEGAWPSAGWTLIGNPTWGKDNSDPCGGCACAQIDVAYDPPDSFPLLSGMAPSANLIGVKVLTDSGTSSESRVLSGLDWVYQNRATYNITVASASFGWSTVLPAVDAAVNNLVDNGVVFVASCGNSQGTGYVGSPASAEKAIAVTALNETDAITEYSSLGDPAGPIKPDVAAPGSSNITYRRIYAPDTNEADGAPYGWLHWDRYNDDYCDFGGTSAACPHVSGLAAVLAAALGGTWDFDSNQHSLLIKNLICLSTSEVQAGEAAIPTLERGSATEPGAPPGKDRTEGYGKINCVAALEAVTGTIGPMAQDADGWQSFTVNFGPGPLDHQVAVRRLDMSADYGYNLILEPPSGADYDLYLYAADYTDGNPELLASGTSPGAGTAEYVNYRPAASTQGFIVARWVSGGGAAQVSVGETSPTVLRVAGLQASGHPERIVLKWRTFCEAGLAGFRLEASRSRDRAYRPLTPGLFATKGEAVGGACYDFVAPRKRGPRWYRLVLIHADGREEPTDPVVVH